MSDKDTSTEPTTQFASRKFAFEVQTTDGSIFLSNAEEPADLLSEFDEDTIASLTKYELVNPQAIDMATFFEDVEDDDDADDDEPFE